MTAGADLDLRAAGVGLVGWLVAWWLLGRPPSWCVLLVLAGCLAVAVRSLRGQRARATTWGWLLAGATVGASTLLHLAAVTGSPVHQLAADRASVRAELTVGTTPVRVPGRFSDQVSFDGSVLRISGRGSTFELDVPVRVLMGADEPAVARGARIRVVGALSPSQRPERAATLHVRGAAEVLAGPSALVRAPERVRAAIRAAVAGDPSPARALVPALVDGDDAALPKPVVEDFRTAGLTHLQAVSGTNLTLILGFGLLLARWGGVRARGLVLVGLVGVLGFVLLSGPEPSVLRAAAMGVIALLGLSTGGRQRGIRALGVGVLVLVVLDPWLARSWGFALSVAATSGILLLAPPWRDRLGRWMPAWLAEAVAVPLAAQLACTPLVAVLAGQVSLVAVLANVLAAPFVAPATVLGLLGGLLGLLWAPLGAVVALPAVWSCAVIVAVARHAAELPLPALSWSPGLLPVATLTGFCVAVALGLHLLLARRGPTLVLACLSVLVVAVPLPTPGWPPAGWVFAACSVGQGDALLLSTGPGAAVVIDAGPEPRVIDRCLRRFRIRAVPIVVITHLHADHVDGLAGVLRGRRVGQVLTTSLAEPVGGARLLHRVADRSRVPVRTVGDGGTARVGPVTWQVLAPGPGSFPESQSPPNDASVVLLVTVRGLRILLMGDEERPAQADLHRRYPELRADVLKVAHHGSSKQDVDLVRGLGARLAVISVGLGNDYGHPAPSTLALLAGAGLQVRRTDRDGDVAVVVGRDGLATVTRPVRR